MSKVIEYIVAALAAIVLAPIVVWFIWISFQIENWIHTSSTIDWWPL